MARVPGIVVANRWNYAQDLQISSRGFGARAGFGVRGIRLYTDGVPATGPAGQGQVSHLDLAGADRVEVLRGPFPVLFGNSSGGVISVFSSPVLATRIEASVDAGSFGLRKLHAQGEAVLAEGTDLRVGAAAMQLDDEIGIATDAGGRSSYQNVSRTRRQGAELSARWQDGGWSAALAATYLDAAYRDDFLVCAGVPWTTPTLPVAAGNRIGATQRASGFAELEHRTAFGEFGVELRGASATAVNGRNTDFAPGRSTVALRRGHGVPLSGGWAAEWLLRLENVADKRYAGSVIVNDGNGRFFETGAPRSALLSLRLAGP